MLPIKKPPENQMAFVGVRRFTDNVFFLFSISVNIYFRTVYCCIIELYENANIFLSFLLLFDINFFLYLYREKYRLTMTLFIII